MLNTIWRHQLTDPISQMKNDNDEHCYEPSRRISMLFRTSVEKFDYDRFFSVNLSIPDFLLIEIRGDSLIIISVPRLDGGYRWYGSLRVLWFWRPFETFCTFLLSGLHMPYCVLKHFGSYIIHGSASLACWQATIANHSSTLPKRSS